MNKKQLRQRIYDIACGAGMYWQEKDECWDYSDGAYENLANFIRELESAFSLMLSARMRVKNQLEKFESLDGVVELMRGVLESDMETEK